MLNKYKVFPKESNGMEDYNRYHKFYMVVDIKQKQYIVKLNNTDRRESESEHTFSNVREATKFLIGKSFTTGGSISRYWGIK